VQRRVRHPGERAVRAPLRQLRDDWPGDILG
jgi:hypothetical protein